jgi:hypothetical protein
LDSFTGLNVVICSSTISECLFIDFLSFGVGGGFIFVFLGATGGGID